MLAVKHHTRENLVFSEVGRPRESQEKLGKLYVIIFVEEIIKTPCEPGENRTPVTRVKTWGISASASTLLRVQNYNTSKIYDFF